jgi:hypothetical protein
MVLSKNSPRLDMQLTRDSQVLQFPLVTSDIRGSKLLACFLITPKTRRVFNISELLFFGIACTLQDKIICKDTWGPYFEVGRSSNFSFGVGLTGSGSADCLVG